MRRAGWAAACVLAGACVAAGFAFAARVAVLRQLPHLAEMEAACGPGVAEAWLAPAFATAATCREYFADVRLVHRTAMTESVVAGLIAAFILLVLRFRVRPLGSPRGQRPGGS